MHDNKLNIYSNDKPCFVWFQFVSDSEDLSLECIGVAPFELDDMYDGLWIDMETQEGGWECIFRTNYYAYNSNYRSWVGFALEHGIAPHQPFRVRFDPPKYTTDYWGECDAVFFWDIIYIDPITDPAQRWQNWLDELEVTAPMAANV